MTPLEELLDTLDRAVAPGDPAFLVAAFGASGDGGVLVTDPTVSHLLGWKVPPECWAVGLVGPGDQLSLEPKDFPRAPSAGAPRSTDRAPRHRAPAEPGVAEPDVAEPGAAEPGAGQMRMCCLVGRDGAIASLLRSPDGTVLASGDAEGRVIDALRRTLGLATPPPERGTADLLAVLWIDNLLAATDAGTVLDWPAAAALHPAMRVLAAEGHGIDVEHVAMVARVATVAWSWENLRLQSCEDNWLSDLVPAGMAEWMDDGMFSRWLMADLPPVPPPTDRLGHVFDAEVWRNVQAVIASSGAGGGHRASSGAKELPDECPRHAAPEPGHRPRAMPRN